MGRTKQTARKVTGGKAPRKSHTNRHTVQNAKRLIEKEDNRSEYEILKEKFFMDPDHDPRNPEKRVIRDKKPYLALVKEFGDPFDFTVNDSNKEEEIKEEIDIYDKDYGNNLIKQLQTYDIYKNKSKKEIIKLIGNIYGIDKASNIELEIELDELQKPKSMNLVDDTMKEILLRADYQTLKTYCMTNKQSQKLCHDKGFWNEKLAYEKLPLILFDKDLGIESERSLENYEIEGYKEQAKTDNDWLILYFLMHEANKEAKKTLLVNKIEANREFKPTAGVIQITDIQFLPGSFYVKKHITQTIDQVKLTLMPKNYILKLYFEDDTEIEEEISHEEALYILTFILFEKYVGSVNSDAYIADSNGVEFFYNKDGTGHGINGNINTALKYMIYETLSYM